MAYRFLKYAENTIIMADSEELKNLLVNVKEESENAGLKLNIQKTKIKASSPITSWQTEGEKLGTVTGFTFLGSEITGWWLAIELKDAYSLEGKLWQTSLLIHFSHVQLFAILWTVAYQAPLSLGFPSLEFWSGLPCPLHWFFLTQRLNPCFMQTVY